MGNVAENVKSLKRKKMLYSLTPEEKKALYQQERRLKQQVASKTKTSGRMSLRSKKQMRKFLIFHSFILFYNDIKHFQAEKIKAVELVHLTPKKLFLKKMLKVLSQFLSTVYYEGGHMKF